LQDMGFAPGAFGISWSDRTLFLHASNREDLGVAVRFGMCGGVDRLWGTTIGGVGLARAVSIVRHARVIPSRDDARI